MREHSPPGVQVKAAGGVRTLDALLDVMRVGVTRVGATATETILEDFKARKAGAPRPATRAAPSSAYSRASSSRREYSTSEAWMRKPIDW